MLNVELLQDTMKHIKENPQTWNQNVWFVHLDENGHRAELAVTVEMTEVNSCNTAFCFAGHAALKSGFPAPPQNGLSWYGAVDGEHYEASDYARQKLGISWTQADILFNGQNTMEDLEVLVDALIENPNIDRDEMRELTSWCDVYGEEYSCDCCSDDDVEDEDTDDTVW